MKNILTKINNKIILIGILFLVVISFSGCDSTSENNNTNTSTSMASIQAKEYVKKSLKSPSTAKFPGLWELANDGVVAYEKETNKYEIISYVDSQNSFGAMIRSNWNVVLKYLGGDDSDIRNWQLERMIIDDKIIYEIQQKTEKEQPIKVKSELSIQQILNARQNYEVVVNNWSSTGWESRYNPNTEKTENHFWTKLDLSVKNNNPDISLDLLTIKVNIKHPVGSDGEDASWGRLSINVSNIKPGKSKTMVVYYPGDLSRVVVMQDVYTTIENTIPEDNYRFFKEFK